MIMITIKRKLIHHKQFQVETFVKPTTHQQEHKNNNETGKFSPFSSWFVIENPKESLIIFTPSPDYSSNLGCSTHRCSFKAFRCRTGKQKCQPGPSKGIKFQPQTVCFWWLCGINFTSLEDSGNSFLFIFREVDDLENILS